MFLKNNKTVKSRAHNVSFYIWATNSLCQKVNFLASIRRKISLLKYELKTFFWMKLAVCSNSSQIKIFKWRKFPIVQMLNLARARGKHDT